jgi:hypothetical protein
MLASGMTENEILGDYPYLEKADFPAVYAYASQAGTGAHISLKLLFDASRHQPRRLRAEAPRRRAGRLLFDANRHQPRRGGRE